MGEYLFVYGTLLPDLAPAPLRPLIAQLIPAGPAHIVGQLYDLGSHPGVVLRGDGEVLGELFALPPDCSLFASLDAYEGVDSERPESSLFRRQRCAAKRPDGTAVDAWVYEYNRSVGRRRPIPSGNYRHWRRGLSG